MKYLYSRIGLGLAAGLVIILLLTVGTSSPPVSLADLPARPTVMPDRQGRTETKGTIQLQAQFSHEWPWNEVHWQDLWTVVQWQDAEGIWHDVEGWKGTLDDVTIGEDGQVVGHKTWWVSKVHLGEGPFRWLVYQKSKRLALSETFHLPGSIGGTEFVQVVLAD
jgi:hypothetical protein